MIKVLYKKYCKKNYISLCILFSVFGRMGLSLPVNSRPSQNAMHICLKLGTFRNTLIQVHANLLKNYFLPNIYYTHQI